MVAFSSTRTFSPEELNQYTRDYELGIVNRVSEGDFMANMTYSANGWANVATTNSTMTVADFEKKYAEKEKSVGSPDIGKVPEYPGDSLAESLFIINPKLRRKYQGDKRALQADIMFAATEKLQSAAATKLAKLLGGE